mgnify:CR=1 FL=1
MEDMSIAELMRALRDKLLEAHERLTLEYSEPLEEFSGSIEELGGINFLYITAGWCAPCISFMDTVRRVARKYLGKARFYKVDIDKSMDLVDYLRVDYIPAFVAVVDGEVVDRVYGVVSYNKLEGVIERVLRSR